MTLDLDADLSGLSVGDRATATANEILRVEVGSTAHGISVGNDDLDLMAVYLQTPEQLLGIGEHGFDIRLTQSEDSAPPCRDR